MARLTDETIDRIKTEISLLRLVESQGHQPKRQGKDWATAARSTKRRYALPDDPAPRATCSTASAATPVGP